MSILVKTIIAAAISLALFAIYPAEANWRPAVSLPEDVVIGNPVAPVTIFEYASLTCPHCARFHETALPEFKASYIDTGKAKIVYRHFPLDQAALAGALAVSCLPAAQREVALDRLFKSVGEWSKQEDLAGATIAALPGDPDPTEVITCMSSKETTEAVAKTAIEASRGGISATPTFIIGEEIVQGTVSAKRLGELVDQATHR